VHQVIHAGLISAAESVTIGFTVVMGNRRMAELFAILHAGLAVILVILARAFNAVVEALRLRSLNLGGWSSPYFVAVIRRRTLLCLCCRNAQECRRCECC